MLNLSSNIKYIKGVGEKRAGLFGSLAIFDVDALIHFFPRKYEDWTKTKTVRELENGDVVSIKATMITPVKEHMIRRGMTLYKCRFSDGESIINVTIFNNKYQAQALRVYEDYVLFGKIEKNLTSASMSSPKIERLDTGVRVHPVYPATGKLTSNAIAKVVKTALESLEEIPETLDKSVRDKYNLISLDRAIRQIHFPDSEEDMQQARHRLIFEELLTLQIGLLKLKGRNKTKTNLRMTADFTEEFKSLLPFEMTNAQKRAIKDCLVDMAGDYPMNRLLQGDVGSGKTAVAAGLCFTVIRNGYQCALMAPTEILAFSFAHLAPQSPSRGSGSGQRPSVRYPDQGGGFRRDTGVLRYVWERRGVGAADRGAWPCDHVFGGAFGGIFRELKADPGLLFRVPDRLYHDRYRHVLSSGLGRGGQSPGSAGGVFAHGKPLPD